MLPGKSIPTESAHIAEELLADSPLSEMDRKCMVVRQSIQDGDYTLEEAMEIYEMNTADYLNFLSKDAANNLQQAVGILTLPHHGAMSRHIENTARMKTLASELTVITNALYIIISHSHIDHILPDNNIEQALVLLKTFTKKIEKDSDTELVSH